MYKQTCWSSQYEMCSFQIIPNIDYTKKFSGYIYSIQFFFFSSGEKTAMFLIRQHFNMVCKALCNPKI